jgi:LPS-assembly lipoprotein
MPADLSPSAAAAPSRRRALQLLSVLASATGLSACGFRLRGSAQPLAFQRLRLEAAAESPLVRALRQQLEASGVTVLDARNPAAPDLAPQAVLTLLQDQRERVVVGTTAAGQVRELALRLRCRLRLRTPTGRALIEDTDLLLERELSFNERQVLGKESEEALLFEDMQAALVRQILARLATVRLD